MGKIFGVLLVAGMVCGSAGAALANTTDGCETQLRAQVQALQNQVAALQTGAVVQSESAADFQMPTGG